MKTNLGILNPLDVPEYQALIKDPRIEDSIEIFDPYYPDPSKDDFVLIFSHPYLVYHHADHLSSAGVDTDKSGQAINQFDYYPFGNTRFEESTGAYQNDFKYTGKELDADTQLSYYGARYYDASIGRFISIDPWAGDITDPQSFNKYSYVMNNPMKYVDPDGRQTAADAAVMGGLAMSDGPLPIGEILAIGYIVIKSAINLSSPPISPSPPVIQDVPPPVNPIGPLINVPAQEPASTTTSFPLIPEINLIDQTSVFPSYDDPSDWIMTREEKSLPLYGTPNSTGIIKDIDGKIKQGRTYDDKGNPKVDIDFSDHGNPKVHSDPHTHDWTPNADGGYDKSSRSKPNNNPQL